MIIFAAPGGIIGARLYYIFSIRTSIATPMAVGALRLVCPPVTVVWRSMGGLLPGSSLPGWWHGIKKIPFPALADVCAFGLLIGQIAGRWGNFYERRGLWRPNGPAFGAWELRWEENIWRSIPHFYMSPCGTWWASACWFGCCGKGIRTFDGMYFFALCSLVRPGTRMD